MKGSRSKLFAVVAFLLIAGACAPAAPPTATPVPPTTIPVPPTPTPAPTARSADTLAFAQKYIDAIDRGDIAAAMAPFEDDGQIVLDTPGGDCSNLLQQLSDAAKIRGWLEYRVALHTQSAGSDCQADGALATCTWRYTDDCSFGVEQAPAMKVAIENDKIHIIIISMKRDRKFMDFEYWLASAHTSDAIWFSKTIDNIAAGYDRAAGEHLSKLCLEYAATLK
ncbi:MAG: hypothetical protein NT169_18935 [Chloroflexi bacterium]|nr:hypothetical protein [Chloroflexota bacterium]